MKTRVKVNLTTMYRTLKILNIIRKKFFMKHKKREKILIKAL